MTRLMAAFLRPCDNEPGAFYLDEVGEFSIFRFGEYAIEDFSDWRAAVAMAGQMYEWPLKISDLKNVKSFIAFMIRFDLLQGLVILNNLTTPPGFIPSSFVIVGLPGIPAIAFWEEVWIELESKEPSFFND